MNLSIPDTRPGSRPTFKPMSGRSVPAHGLGRAISALASLLWTTTGCIAMLDDEPTPEPMCIHTADCETGELCDDGICWGNPPPRTFAAILNPPGGGDAELAPTEIPELVIRPDGTVDNLVFAETARIDGRIAIECGDPPRSGCDPDRSINARITFTRPSLIPGQPPYSRTVTSVAGRPSGEPSFAIALPISDTEYQVRIVPQGVSTNAGPDANAAALAPPSVEVLVADADMDIEWKLGAPDTHKQIAGRVYDVLDAPLVGMQVFAVASAGPASVDERISSVIDTDEEGRFTLGVSDSLEDGFDLIALPHDADDMPILRVTGRRAVPWDPVQTTPVDVGVMRMPSYGLPGQYTLPVRGIDGSGDEMDIPGVTVKVTTVLSEIGDTTATFSTVAYTEEGGGAVLDLIPGNITQNRTYVADFEPLAGSEHAVKHGHLLDVALQGGVLEPIRLDRRIPVGGQIVTATGEPAANTTIEARLSPSFRLDLTPEERALVDSLSLSSALADQSGRFVLWLDETLTHATAVYALRLTQADPLAPLWTIRDVDMSQKNEYNTVELSVVTLPSASYARGVISNAGGIPVPNAELRLFEVIRDDPTCQDPGLLCPSVFRGLSDADDQGQVMLVLPE